MLQKNQPILFYLLMFIVACNNYEFPEPLPDPPLPARIILTDIEIIEISARRNGIAWDGDGSGPDLYIMLAETGPEARFNSDTLFDAPATGQILENSIMVPLGDTMVIDSSAEAIVFHIRDYDPEHPFGLDDVGARITVSPLGEIWGFRDPDGLDTSSGSLRVKFHYTHEF